MKRRNLLPGQSLAGAIYTQRLRAECRKRTRGLKGVMGVREFIVPPVLQVAAPGFLHYTNL